MRFTVCSSCGCPPASAAVQAERPVPSNASTVSSPQPPDASTSAAGHTHTQSHTHVHRFDRQQRCRGQMFYRGRQRQQRTLGVEQRQTRVHCLSRTITAHTATHHRLKHTHTLIRTGRFTLQPLSESWPLDTSHTLRK